MLSFKPRVGKVKTSLTTGGFIVISPKKNMYIWWAVANLETKT